MKKIIALAFVLLASIVSAQETYSVTVNLPANVAKLDIGRQLTNKANCSRYSALPATCTQAEACSASFAATGQPSTGASCSISEANAAGVRIYSNNQAGREAFISLEMVKSSLDTYGRAKAQLDLAVMQGFCKVATQPQVDQLCTDTGQSAGCGVCDSFR